MSLSRQSFKIIIIPKSATYREAVIEEQLLSMRYANESEEVILTKSENEAGSTLGI